MKTFYFVLLTSILFLLYPMVYGQKGTGALKVPDKIKTPSHVGEVNFPHRAHADEYDVKCGSCHHKIKASALKIPHKFNSRSNWKDCQYCHNPGKSSGNIYSCRKCHSELEKSSMKQILSYKVVIHKSCEGCHQLGRGVEASKSCKFCHSGQKLEYK